MKRMIAAILCLSMLCAFSAAMADPFTFPNGVQWGMMVDEVKTREMETPQAASLQEGHVVSLAYTGQRISRYTADKWYDFSNDELVLVTYAIANQDHNEFRYLEKALTSVYGEPSYLSTQRILSLYYALEVEPVTDAFSYGSQWTANDDTQIWLYMCWDSIILLYMDADINFSMMGYVDTTGL